jgi:hypothetical protein
MGLSHVTARIATALASERYDMSWFHRGALFLLWTLYLGCAATHPFYEGRSIEQPPIREYHRSIMVIRIDQAIKDGRISGFEMDTPEGHFVIHPQGPGSPALDFLPLPVLTAAFEALHRRFIGAEWDRIIVLGSGERVPVTIFRELDGRMRIAMGPPLADSATDPVSEEEIRARYGIGPIRRGDVDWTDLQRRDLEQALSLLDDRELLVLSGMPVYRYHAAPNGDHNITARYMKVNGYPEIQLYDSLFARSEMNFVGDPNDPIRPSVGDILHEMGHAIADAALLTLLHERRQAIRDIGALSASYEDARRRTDAAEARRFGGQLSEQLADFNDAGARLEGEAELSLVLREYLRVRGPVKGPTPYGRTSPSESFAESFSLFHADPAALRRVYPAVLEWFTRGGHVSSMKQAMGSHRFHVSSASLHPPG